LLWKNSSWCNLFRAQGTHLRPPYETAANPISWPEVENSHGETGISRLIHYESSHTQKRLLAIFNTAPRPSSVRSRRPKVFQCPIRHLNKEKNTKAHKDLREERCPCVNFCIPGQVSRKTTMSKFSIHYLSFAHV
jgi:hypothetical protein